MCIPASPIVHIRFTGYIMDFEEWKEKLWQGKIQSGVFSWKQSVASLKFKKYTSCIMETLKNHNADSDFLIWNINQY